MARLSTVLMLLLAPGWIWAGQGWRGKPLAEWTLEDAIALQFHSPWVAVKPKASLRRDVDLDRPYIFSDAGFVHYTIRLRSARPLLLAYACLVHYLPGPHLRRIAPWDADKAIGFADQMEAMDQIVVAVTSKPSVYAYPLNLESLERLKESTFLRLEPQGSVIPLKAFVSSSHSLSGEALFIFPRPKRPLPPSGTLRFVTEFKSEYGVQVRLDHGFKIRNLLFRGKPAY